MAFPKRSDEFVAGFDAFEANKPMASCPHDPKSQKGKEWLRGWATAKQIKEQKIDSPE